MLHGIAPSALGQARPCVPPATENPVEIGLARTPGDLLAAFRLLYLSYVRAGLTAENDQQLRVTPHHALPTTEVFVAKCRGEVVSTMTMVGDAGLGLPIQSMYGDRIVQLRRSGLQLAEMGCFADRRTSPARFKDVFNQLARLVVQVARARNIDALVAATHPKHARFYIRWLGFERIGDLTQCPYAAGSPAVALLLDFAAIENTAAHDRLFGKSIAPEHLIPTRWNPETVDFLQRLAEPNDALQATAITDQLAPIAAHAQQEAVVMPPVA